MELKKYYLSNADILKILNIKEDLQLLDFISDLCNDAYEEGYQKGCEDSY